jgi:hypothetical protein
VLEPEVVVRPPRRMLLHDEPTAVEPRRTEGLGGSIRPSLCAISL